MSERGSFVTEYIYCDKCFEAVKSVLMKKYGSQSIVIYETLSNGKHFDLPIIAGKTSGLGSGDDLVDMEIDIIPELEEVVCCKVRIAVISEGDEKVFVANPKIKNP